MEWSGEESPGREKEKRKPHLSFLEFFLVFYFVCVSCKKIFFEVFFCNRS